jgi:hypothetical protein
MFDLYTLICFLTFILLIIWFLFTEHEEEPTPTPPRPKKKPKPSEIKEVIDECVGAVEDAALLQEELDTERNALIQTIRRRLKPSGASSARD